MFLLIFIVQAACAVINLAVYAMCGNPINLGVAVFCGSLALATLVQWVKS